LLVVEHRVAADGEHVEPPGLPREHDGRRRHPRLLPREQVLPVAVLQADAHPAVLLDGKAVGRRALFEVAHQVRAVEFDLVGLVGEVGEIDLDLDRVVRPALVGAVH
jgi:hypothetical protein